MQDASAMFKSFLLVLIGVVLVPVIQQLCNDANVTGATATIVAIIPLLFSLGILWSQAKTLFWFWVLTLSQRQEGKNIFYFFLSFSIERYKRKRNTTEAGIITKSFSRQAWTKTLSHTIVAHLLQNLLCSQKTFFTQSSSSIIMITFRRNFFRQRAEQKCLSVWLNFCTASSLSGFSLKSRW